MSTFGIMQAEIADDLARSDLTDQIKNAIKSAIRYYDKKRYAFNEKTYDFDLVASQEYYGVADLADIPDMFAIDGLKCNVNGTNYPVKEKTFKQIDDISTSSASVGDPIFYCYYAQKIRFYPIPNEARVITVSYAFKPAVLVNDADTNVWMTDGYDLIKARAKSDIYENVIHDVANADRMRLLARELNSCLVAEYEGKNTGGFTPTEF